MHRDSPFFSNIDCWLLDCHRVRGRVVRELEMPALATYKKLDKKGLTFNCSLFQAIITDEMRQGRLAYLVREEGVKMAAKKARSLLHSRVSNAQ